MKKSIGILLIVYAALQSTPLFLSNIIVFTLIYFGSFLLLVRKEGFKINVNFFTVFIICWLIYGIISYIWSVDKYLWFRSNIIVGNLLVSIMIFNYLIDSKDKILFFSKAWFWVVVIVQIIAWYEIATSNYHFTTGDTLPGITYNWPLVSFFNTNDFSTYITVSLPIALLWTKEIKQYGKLITIIFSLSTFLLLYQADSRANLLALIIGLAAYFLLSRIHLMSNKLVMLIGLLFLAIPILFFFDFPERIFTLINSNLQEDTLRINLIKNGLSLLNESNFLGVGAGNSQYWLPIYNKYTSSEMMWIHNWWAEILVDFGIIIFIGYVISYFRTAYINLKIYIENNDYLPLYLVICLFIFALASMSPSTIIMMKWLPLLTGFVVSSTNYLNGNN